MTNQIIFKINDLPDKIKQALGEKKKLKGDFVFSFKTLYKPNATIPILWFTVLTDGIIFLNTHKTRGAWKEIEPKEINCIKLICGSSEENILTIVSNDIYEDDFVMPIPFDVDLSVLKIRLTEVGYSVF